MPDDSLVKKAYVEQKLLKFDWYKTNVDLLENFDQLNYKRASINVNVMLERQFVQKWTEAKNSSSKLQFYASIKCEFKRENYLKLYNPEHRSCITKLRISSHDLEVEKGRYTKDPVTGSTTLRDNRTCHYCKVLLLTDKVEDEHHVLNTCPLYTKSRMTLSQSTNKKAIDILADSSNLLEASFLGKFIHTIFDVRQAFIDFTTAEPLDDTNNDNATITN